MTYNPKWPEIMDNSPAGDKALKHHIAVDRAFNDKLSEMIEEICFLG